MSKELHDKILSLPCPATQSQFATRHELNCFKDGHQAAREASAALALDAAAPQVVAEAPTAEEYAAVFANEALDQVMKERDYNAEMADKLADGIAEHFGAEIGEHSSANCPWVQALDLLNTKPEFIECAGSKHAAPAAQGDAKDAELARIKRLATCGTVDSFLLLPDQDKRYWFAMAWQESDSRKLSEERIAFLHSTNKDADGYEFGIAKVKFDAAGKIESFLWGLGDNSDLDAAIAAKAAS